MNLSSFSPNVEEENIGGSSSQRPIGIKKAKLKRKVEDGTTAAINSLQEGNKHLLDQLKESRAQRQQHLEIQNKKYALKEISEENKILCQDLNSLQDPDVRQYFQGERARILQKRAEQRQHQKDVPPPATFGEYFNNLSGTGSDLPDY